MRLSASASWRVLCVALVGLASCVASSPAGALATPVLESQSAVVTLSAHSGATLTAQFTNVPSSTSIDIAVWPRATERSTLDHVMSGAGDATTPIFEATTTGCSHAGVTTVALHIGERASRSTCGPATSLVVHCYGQSCDGVYPVRFDIAGASLWSFVTIRTAAVKHPLSVVPVLVATSPAVSTSRLAGDFAALSGDSGPVTVALGYDELATLARSHHSAEALRRALNNTEHQIVNAPSPTIDFGGLVDNGLSSEITRQLSLASTLATGLTGRYLAGPLWLEGAPSLATLNALAGAGQTNLVVPESSLIYPPSSGLYWGAPFHVMGAAGVTALTSDSDVNAVINGTTPVAQRALWVSELVNFMHFESPNDTTTRSVVMSMSSAHVDGTFLSTVLAQLAHDPYVSTSSLAPEFSSHLIGTSGVPVTKGLVSTTAPAWSSQNVATLVALTGEIQSYAQAVATTSVATHLSQQLADAEIVGTPGSRQGALDRVVDSLNRDKAYFSIDESAVTLAGSGTSLPITIESRAPYTVTAVVHLITTRLGFPHGSVVPITLDAPTKSLRVAVTGGSRSSLVLQVVVTTPDGQVVLAHAAVQVNVARTSWVGYLLTGLSLFVLAAWWLRSVRKRRR